MVKNNNGPIIQQEKIAVSYMIGLYCHKKHHQSNNQLCQNCEDLKQYALSRLTFCRYSEEKSTCEKCPTHCYRKDFQAQIREVMRFSGPRMLLYHPIIAIKHLIRNISTRNNKI